MSPKRRFPMRMAGVLLYWISHVGEAWIPSLFSRRRILTVSSRSTRNMERPRASVEPSSLRARTSDTSASPLVMKRLTPLRRHWPVASSRVARVATAPRSEPASASVRTIAPETSPREERGLAESLDGVQGGRGVGHLAGFVVGALLVRLGGPGRHALTADLAQDV